MSTNQMSGLLALNNSTLSPDYKEWDNTDGVAILAGTYHVRVNNVKLTSTNPTNTSTSYNHANYTFVFVKGTYQVNRASLNISY